MAQPKMQEEHVIATIFWITFKLDLDCLHSYTKILF